MPESRKFIVFGLVQGVWFRVCTEEQANEIGVTGWVRNLTDGSVEVCAWGNAEQINTLEKWLWIGSPMSNVTSVTSYHLTESPPGDFRVR